MIQLVDSGGILYTLSSLTLKIRCFSLKISNIGIVSVDIHINLNFKVTNSKKMCEMGGGGFPTVIFDGFPYNLANKNKDI